MNLYQENILDHYKNPRNFGTFANADIDHEEFNPLCGDRFHFYLRLNGGKVSEVRFDGYGCAISTASASMLTDQLIGKTTEEILQIGVKEILKNLGIELNPTRLKCALIGLETVQKGITMRATE